MKKLKKALSVLLASATIAQACPMQQKASALTPAEAAVIGIFGAGALAGGVAAVCLGVQNANIKNELKKEKEAKKENPVGQSSELTRSQLDKAMRELATVKAQMEKYKKDYETCSEELTKYKQKLETSQKNYDVLLQKYNELSLKSKLSNDEKDFLLESKGRELTEAEEAHERLSEELRNSKARAEQLQQNAKELSKEYNNLMLYSLACKFLAIRSEKPELQKHITALEPYKTDENSITAEDIANLFGVIYVYGYDGRFTYQLHDLCKFADSEATEKSGKNIISIFMFNITAMIKELMASLRNTGIEKIQKEFIQREMLNAHAAYKNYYDITYDEMKKEKDE